MQITIDDTIYYDLAEKIGSTNVSAYIQSLLQPILYFNGENHVEKVEPKKSSFDEVFGMLKTDKHVTLEEMDEVIRQRGAGL